MVAIFGHPPFQKFLPQRRRDRKGSQSQSSKNPKYMDPRAAKPKPSFSIRRVFIILLLLLGSLVAFVLLLPFLIRSPHEGRNRSEVVHGSRQIGLALLEFEAEYGTFPNALTSAKITKDHPEHGFDLAGTTSNALFRQLFAADFIQSE